jgi:hypothetical protein
MNIFTLVLFLFPFSEVSIAWSSMAPEGSARLFVLRHATLLAVIPPLAAASVGCAGVAVFVGVPG